MIDRKRHRVAMAFGVTLVLAGCLDPVASSLYQPKPLAAPPAWGARAPRLVTVTAADGATLTGWYWPPESESGDTLVFFPGRSGNRDLAATAAQAFARDGRGLLVASYRGYGDNPGKPDEEGLYADGLAFAKAARQLHPGGRLYLFGDALGAAVALRTAGALGAGAVDGVAILGAFDRFSSFAPASMRGLYRGAYDNVAAIARVTAPVLILHGRKDEVVPFAAAERLRAAAGGAALVAPIEGEAYHSFDLTHIAPTVWAALDEMATPKTR